MKVATFNVNGVNGRLPLLLDWLAEAEPDIVCLQELKSVSFPSADLEKAGYGSIVSGERNWNGVAILARNAEPVPTRDRLPGDDADVQARYIEAAVKGLIVAGLYLPNGNPQPGPKFDYKNAWFRRLNDHASGLFASGLPVVLAGDFNVVPTDRDIYPSKSYDDNALLQPEPRALYAELVGQGWTDALRARFPDERVYTFWDYKRNRWPRDAGLRLDHILLSPDLAGTMRDAGVDRHVRGWEHASDHAPVWVELGDGKVARKRKRRLFKAEGGRPPPASALRSPRR